MESGCFESAFQKRQLAARGQCHLPLLKHEVEAIALQPAGAARSGNGRQLGEIAGLDVLQRELHIDHAVGYGRAAKGVGDGLTRHVDVKLTGGNVALADVGVQPLAGIGGDDRRPQFLNDADGQIAHHPAQADADRLALAFEAAADTDAGVSGLQDEILDIQSIFDNGGEPLKLDAFELKRVLGLAAGPDGKILGIEGNLQRGEAAVLKPLRYDFSLELGLTPTKPQRAVGDEKGAGRRIEVDAQKPLGDGDRVGDVIWEADHALGSREFSGGSRDDAVLRQLQLRLAGKRESHLSELVQRKHLAGQIGRHEIEDPGAHRESAGSGAVVGDQLGTPRLLAGSDGHVGEERKAVWHATKHKVGGRRIPARLVELIEEAQRRVRHLHGVEGRNSGAASARQELLRQEVLQLARGRRILGRFG